MEKILFQYVRDNKNRKIGAVVALVVGNGRTAGITFGYSQCSKEDFVDGKIDVQHAKDLAIGRAIRFCSESPSAIPGYTHKTLKSFVPRAVRYYQNAQTCSAYFVRRYLKNVVINKPNPAQTTNFEPVQEGL